MKTFKTLVAAAILGSAVAVHAVPSLIDSISHDSFKDFGNGDAAGSAAWLNSLEGTSFVASDGVHLDLSSILDVSGYSYLVLHYGRGNDHNDDLNHAFGNGSKKKENQPKDTTTPGGGYEVWALDGAFTFTTGSQNPFGKGGLSWAIAFGSPEMEKVPDGGMTLMLLGSGILGIGALRWHRSR